RTPKPTMRMTTMNERTLACRCRRSHSRTCMDATPLLRPLLSCTSARAADTTGNPRSDHAPGAGPLAVRPGGVASSTIAQSRHIEAGLWGLLWLAAHPRGDLTMQGM